MVGVKFTVIDTVFIMFCIWYVQEEIDMDQYTERIIDNLSWFEPKIKWKLTKHYTDTYRDCCAVYIKQ